MNIIVLGAGKVGETICKDLSEENHDITLIENDEKRFQILTTKYDIKGVFGNGATYEVLHEADVENCDVFLAVTENDEINMISCVIAKNMGAKKTWARVRNPEYSSLSKTMSKSLGLTNFINPEKDAAIVCQQLIDFPVAESFESFSNDKAAIVEIRITDNFPLINKNLVSFRTKYPNLIVCFVQDGGETFIPKGDYIIKENNHLFVTGSFSELRKLYKDNGQVENRIKSILIIGGGLVVEYLLTFFKDRKIDIKVIEVDDKRASKLSELFPNIEVINADGTSVEILDEQRISSYDAVLAMTGIDEENIVITMVAESKGVKKRLAKVNRTELLRIIDSNSLQSIITPKRITADNMVQYIRALGNSQGSNVEALYKLCDNQIEVLQFRVKEGSKATEKMIKETKFIDNILIAYIYRNGKLMFPSGNDRIKANDRVIIISSGERHLNDLDEIVLWI